MSGTGTTTTGEAQAGETTGAVLSPVVTELLAIMGEGGGPEPALEPLPPLAKPALKDGTASPANRSDNRQAMKAAFQKSYQDTPAGATKARVDALSRLRWQFTSALDLDPEDESGSQSVKDAYDALVAEFETARLEVAKTDAKRKQLSAALDQAVKPGPRQPLVAGSSAEEARPLFDRRDSIADALKAPATGEPGVPLAAVAAEAEKIVELAGDAAAFITAMKAREAARKRLTEQLAATIAPAATEGAPDSVVPGATGADVKPLLTERDRIAEVLRTAAAIEPLTAESAKIGALKLLKGKLADTVALRQQRKATIAKAAAEALTVRHPENDPEALSTEAVDALLEPAPLTDDQLKKADAALVQLRIDVKAERENLLDRIARKGAYAKRIEALRALVDQMQEACGDLDLSGAEGQLASLEGDLEGPVHSLDFDGENGGEPFEGQLRSVQDSLDDAIQAIRQEGSGASDEEAAALIAYVKGAAEAVLAEARRLKPFLEDADGVIGGLEGQQKEIADALTPQDEPAEAEAPAKKGGKGKKPPPKKQAAKGAKKGAKPAAATEADAPAMPSRKSIDAALDTLDEMRTTIGTARDSAGAEAMKRTQLRDALLDRIAPEDPSKLPAGLPAALEARRDAVRDLLGEEMSAEVTDGVIEEARREVELFESDFAAAEEVATLWDKSEKNFSKTRDGARKPLQGELNARRKAVLDAATAGDPQATLAACRSLADLLTRTEGETAKAKDARDALGGVKVGNASLDPKTVNEIYDLVGPDAVSGLKPDALATLSACFHGASGAVLANLRALVTEGFGAEGRVLAGLVRSGDKDGILALAAAYGGDGAKDDRANLRGLVVGGGIGEAPTVLDDLVSYGVRAAPDGEKKGQRDANIARLKDLGTAFGDPDGPARMRTLVQDCGLGAKRPEDPPRPGVMAELLDGGFAGDAEQLRKFANEYAGTEPEDATDRARLKGLVEEGGFGDRPRALAPLVERLAKGGMGAGVAKLKEIGSTFAADEDRAKLKRLLDDGGMSGDTRDEKGVTDGARKHEHADTLAKVFTDGLTERADKLKEFTDAFGGSGGHAEECRHMLEAWNEFPDDHAGDRQPGDQIKRLLGPKHLGDDVGRLQTQFTTQMEKLDPGKRELATRFAPHFDQEDPGPNGALPQPAGLKGKGVDKTIMSYILKRHVPKYAQRSMLAAQNSYFPVNTSPAQLAAIIQAAMNQPGAPGRGGDATVPASGGMSVHIALAADGNIPHCYPTSGPGSPRPDETAEFSNFEANKIFDAVEP